MKSHVYFWILRTCFRTLTWWLYIMFLDTERTIKAFRRNSFPHWYPQIVLLVSIRIPTKWQTRSQFQFNRAPYQYLTTSLKKDLDPHQWMIKVETATGNPLTSYDEIQCLGISFISFSVITWMFIRQSNNAPAGLNLQSKNKIPNFQYSLFALTSSSWMTWTLWILATSYG